VFLAGGTFVLTLTFPIEYLGPRWRSFGGGFGLGRVTVNRDDYDDDVDDDNRFKL
jgi:hypothetical protein